MLCTSMPALGPPTRASLESITVSGHASLRQARLRHPPSALRFLHAIVFAFSASVAHHEHGLKVCATIT
ncbi:hypothetical protein RSOLAG1IB_07550 [Rhizoctonia solani AG-1 IB]|uniref:Uncharacterized protein n=1 Tax=Thanatephorus cucumeris (strain AG1-IB / isolate 7/3/14) TaxID=1108050 RepID=A0A0B7FIY9_THACB|nr:hypothetical protein RSOLAG1IB_07550 [Rhizoctonia solani AG-1 IB]